jgi:hypothetical protein
VQQPVHILPAVFPNPLPYIFFKKLLAQKKSEKGGAGKQTGADGETRLHKSKLPNLRGLQYGEAGHIPKKSPGIF